MPQRRSVRLSWVFTAVLALGAALVLLRRMPEPEAVPDAGTAVAATDAGHGERGTTMAEVPHEHPVASEAPHADAPHFDEPHADDPPDPAGAVDPDGANPAIEPEQPQTAEWRLEKTTRLVTMVRDRIARLEQRAAEASRSGDAATGETMRILLERARRRLTTLEGEVEELRGEVAGGGGVAPDEATP